jgi:hypothetical protein
MIFIECEAISQKAKDSLLSMQQQRKKRKRTGLTKLFIYAMFLS